MSTRGPRQNDWWLLLRRHTGLRKHHFDSLVTEQLDAGPPVYPSAPILPEQRSRTNDEGMQEDADLTRLCSGVAIPLALLAQGTGAATANAGRIHHAQAAISFSTLFLDAKLLACWAAKGSIWLEGEIVTREATSLPC
jgi:hypothetical protein